MTLRVAGGPVRGRRIRSGVSDSVLRAGGIYLANPATGLLLPGFAYSRPGPDWWLPQADGTMASFSGASGLMPRSYRDGRWGFEVHPGWTQYITRTHDFGHASWTKRRATAVPVSIATPDGLGSAFKLVEDTTPATSHYLESEAVSLAATRGCFVVKAGEVTEVGIRYVRDTGAGFGGGNARLDLLTGAVTLGTLNVEQLADGWWKVTGIPDGTATTNVSIRLSLVKGGSENYNGDGTSGVYVLAANATSTAYPVPLTAADGTAAPPIGNHSCIATLADLGITLGSEYGVGVEYIPVSAGTEHATVIRLDSDNNNRVSVRRTQGGSYETNIISGMGASTQYYVTSAGAKDQRRKAAIRVSTNNTRAAVDGGLLQADGDGLSVVPPATVVRLGHGLTVGAEVLAGRITSPYLIPNRALTDTELQALTAP